MFPSKIYEFIKFMSRLLIKEKKSFNYVNWMRKASAHIRWTTFQCIVNPGVYIRSIIYVSFRIDRTGHTTSRDFRSNIIR